MNDRRASIWLRSGYWWGSAATASLIPYLALHYRNLGFAGERIGVLLAVLPLGAALLAPFWGVVADTFAAHRLILRCVLAASAVCAMLLSRADSFATVLLLLSLLSICAAPVPSLFDSYGVTLAERMGASYGTLRIWGSLGYIAAALVVGRWMGGVVSGVFFAAYAGCMALALLSSFGLPALTLHTSRHAWRGVGRLLSQGSMLALLLTTFLAWSAMSIMYNFIGILVEERGGDTGIIGTAFALSATSELPVLAFSAWFFRRLGSSRMIALALALYSVRLLILSLVPSAGWILPVQLLHGLTYGLFLTASVTLAHQIAGQELAATGQGLLSSMSAGFGMITGSLVGGALLDDAGVTALFRLASAMMFTALVVFLIGRRFLPAAATTPPLRASANEEASAPSAAGAEERIA